MNHPLPERAASAIFVLWLGLCATVSAQEPTETGPLSETVTQVREIGVAMFRWSEDNAGGVFEMASADFVDLSDIDIITADDLEPLLVPRYLPTLNRVDSWGRQLEFRMTRSSDGAKLAVRSGGTDQALSPTRYEIGPFAATDTDAGHDIVWINGYYVRWPTR